MSLVTIFLSLVVIFTILTLLTNIFVITSKYKKILIVLIPLQLSMATFGYFAVDTILGYATTNVSELQNKEHKFTYINHIKLGSDLYLLAIPYKKTEPRLYVWRGDSKDKEKELQKLQKGMEGAKKKLEDGNVVDGFIDDQGEYLWELRDFQKTSPKGSLE